MQNKFGLKDFVLLVLVIIIGISIWLNMRQEDRRFVKVRNIENRMVGLEQQLARLDRRLEEGVVAIPTEGGADDRQGSHRDGQAQGGRPTQVRDESWARPGVPVHWFGRVTFATDPRDLPGFAYGGEFTEIFEAQPVKITATLAEDTYGRRIADLVCERLADFDPITLKSKGTLAEAWQYDPEGHWLRVKIHPTARFSDGEPVTAEDVRWTFHDYIMNSELETESIRPNLSRIDRVEVLSERILEFHFKQPDAYNFQSSMGFYVLPKHFYSRFTPSQINQSTGLLMGSGPFMVRNLNPNDQWTPGQDVVLVRNEQYWGARPPLERLRFKSISDELARLVAYRNGEGDMIMPSSPQFTQAIREPGWDETTHSLNWFNMRAGYAFIGWQCGPRNGRLTPFHDKRVRQAMTMLLDREAMIRDIWSGIGAVAVGPNNPPSPAADPNVSPWPYDPSRARTLLAEAGWQDRRGDGVLRNERGDPFVFEFTRSAGGQIHERIAKYIIDQCALAGIRCVERVVDWSQYDQILKTRDFDALIMGWSASAPESDPTQIWHSQSIENQGHNFIQWRHPDQDRLVEGIRGELDYEKRLEIHHEFHRLLHEEQPYTFVRASPWLRFVRKDFGNVNTYPKGLEVWEFFRASAESRPTAGK
jgi:peptide/nickel transport system substrate-binding protein